MCLPLAVLGPIIGGALGAAGSAASSAIGGGAAAGAQKDAANQMAGVQNRAIGFQQQVYDQQRADQAPWLQAGQSSLGELMRQMQAGQFETPYTQFDSSSLATDPGYQFRMAEGQKALERSAAARGGLNSGGTMKSLAQYSQGLASDEFQNAWGRHNAEYGIRQGENMNRYNRLAGLAGTGQQSAQSLGAFGGQFGNQMGAGANSLSEILASMGNANAAQYMGNANAIGNGINQFAGGLGYGLMQSGGQKIPTQQQNSVGLSRGYVPSFNFNLDYGG